jgi:hypothetical protein
MGIVCRVIIKLTCGELDELLKYSSGPFGCEGEKGAKFITGIGMVGAMVAVSERLLGFLLLRPAAFLSVFPRCFCFRL